MTPTWAVVLVGLAGGFIGSLLTTLVRISHERGAEIRAHMLNAADAFSSAFVAAADHGYEFINRIEKSTAPVVDDDGSLRPEFQTYLDEWTRSWTETISARARVDLLFGDQSPTGVAARNVATHLHHMNSALEVWPSGRFKDVGTHYVRYDGDAHDAHGRFTRAARAALTETWWSRLRDRMRPEREES